MAFAAENLVGKSDTHASPRLVSRIVEESSWVDDSYLTDMWAGLLAASCDEKGDDDSNIMFVSLVEQLTKVQSRLLKHFCETAPKYVGSNGFPYAQAIAVFAEELMRIAECTDIHRIDRELDSLRGLELIDGGFDIYEDGSFANVTPSSLALHLYVRCQGSRMNPVEYFGLIVRDPKDSLSDNIDELE